MSSDSGKKTSILDARINKTRGEVSTSLFTSFFSQYIQYFQDRSDTSSGLAQKLSDLGHKVGSRLFELNMFREKSRKRYQTLSSILVYIAKDFWRALFGETAKARHVESDGEDNREQYLIVFEPSDPSDLFFNLITQDSSSAEFICGIIQGVLDSAKIPAEVTSANYDEVNLGYLVTSLIPQV